MAKIHPELFQEYELRGIIGRTEMRRLGRTLAQYFQKLPPDEELIIAKDQSGLVESLQAVLVDQLLQAGLKLADLGEVPSPLFYFAPHHLDYSKGVFLSAGADGSLGLVILNEKQLIHGKELQRLAMLFRQLATVSSLSSEQGRVRSVSMMIPYMRMLRQKLKFARQPKIVVDFQCRYDAFFVTYLFVSLGCEVSSVDCQPHFFQKEPPYDEKERLADLGDVVRLEKADLGFLFASGGEGLIVVDEKGKVVSSQKLMPLFLEEMLAQRPGGVLVKRNCPEELVGKIRELGGTPIFYKAISPLATGAELAKHGAIFAMDRGHLFFRK